MPGSSGHVEIVQERERTNDGKLGGLHNSISSSSKVLDPEHVKDMVLREKEQTFKSNMRTAAVQRKDRTGKSP